MMSNPRMVQSSLNEDTRALDNQSYPGVTLGALPLAKDHSWHWAVGGFLFFIGGAMLVAPHEYDVVWRVLPLPYSAWWGSLYVVTGLALLALPALLPQAWFSAAAYVAGAALMLALAGVYASAGRLIGVAGHVPLAAGCLVALLLTVSQRRGAGRSEWDAGEVQADLLRSALGLCGALAGLVLLLAPGQSADPAFDPIRPFLPWSGLLLLVAGAALALLPLVPLPRPTRFRVVGFASIASAVMCLAYVVVAFRQASNWPGIAYFGWLGLILGLQPVLAKWSGNLPAPGSLRVRFAFLLAAAAAIPLIIVVAFVSDHMERAGRADALERQQAQASALAEEVATYLNFQQQALVSLAGEPGLAAMSLREQQRELQSYQEAFPDALSFTLYRADGVPLASSNGVSSTHPATVYPISAAVRSARRPTVDITTTPDFNRPVVRFAEPIVDARGQFAGLVSTSLDSNQLAKLLAGRARGPELVYMVSGAGRALAYPDSSLVESFADLSGAPPVAVALAAPDPSGFLSYDAGSGEQLAGYARVPGTPWIVVVTDDASTILADMRAGREFAFFVLLASVLVMALLGWWVARRLANPLEGLANASAALARGNATAPLPASGIAEADYLAAAFGAMRSALAERSLKLQRRDNELRVTAEQLMAANRALQTSHQQLQSLTRRLLQVQEEERRTLSRDLHDTAAQSMTALGIGLTLLERQTRPTPEQASQIQSLRQTADEVMEDLHRLALNLRPFSLDRSGLVPALEQLLESFRKQSDAETDLLVHGMGDRRLPPEVETTLYRIVQEALTNIGRYANAHHVDVTLLRTEGSVELVVDDDGVGFDVEEALSRGRLGLLGMRERAEMLGGTLKIGSSKGSGSSITATLPLPPDDGLNDPSEPGR